MTFGGHRPLGKKASPTLVGLAVRLSLFNETRT
jgi:hypothetical protein